MPEWLNFLDSFFFITLLVSGIIAYFRGFVKEFFAITSWFIAAFFVKFLMPVLEPFVAQGLGGEVSIWSSTISYSLSFFFCIVLVSWIASKFSQKVHTTNLKNIDKSLGFFFGLLRGVFVVAVFYIGVLYFSSNAKNKPEWINEDAKSKPVIEFSVKLVSKLFPNTETFDNVNAILEGNSEGFKVEKVVNKAIENKDVVIKAVKDSGVSNGLANGEGFDVNSVDFDSLIDINQDKTSYTDEEIESLEDMMGKLKELDEIEKNLMD